MCPLTILEKYKWGYSLELALYLIACRIYEGSSKIDLLGGGGVKSLILTESYTPIRMCKSRLSIFETGRQYYSWRLGSWRLIIQFRSGGSFIKMSTRLGCFSEVWENTISGNLFSSCIFYCFFWTSLSLIPAARRDPQKLLEYFPLRLHPATHKNVASFHGNFNCIPTMLSKHPTPP